MAHRLAEAVGRLGIVEGALAAAARVLHVRGDTLLRASNQHLRTLPSDDLSAWPEDLRARIALKHRSDEAAGAADADTVSQHAQALCDQMGAALQREAAVRAASAAREDAQAQRLPYTALEQRLGYTRGVITHHFLDRDEIVGAVLASAVAEIDAATMAQLPRGGDAAAAMRAVVDTKVRGFLNHPEATAILVSFWGRTDAWATTVHRSLFRRWRDEAATLFLGRRGGRAEDPAARREAYARGALLVGAVMGIVTQVRFDPEFIDVDATIAAAAACFTPAGSDRGAPGIGADARP